MDLRSPRARLAIAAGALVALLGWFLWWRTPAVQAPRTFALLQRAFADGRAGDVLAQVHRDYGLRAHWPAAPWEAIGGDDERASAGRALTMLFLMHRDDRLHLEVEVHQVTTGADGHTAVTASLRLASERGAQPISPVSRHRFVLAPDSWTGHLAIIDHDPIALGSDGALQRAEEGQ
jgi:hypothetical protein